MNHKQWKTGRSGLGVLFLPILLLACGVLVGGCESDSVAPHDEIPELTEKEAAQQVALVAAGLAKVAPQLLLYDGTKSGDKDEEGVYTQDFANFDYITGTVILEYFNGGPGGFHCVWDEADYGLLYTWDDPETSEVDGVTVALDLGGGVEPIFDLTFGLHGNIDQEADTATVSGEGTLLMEGLPPQPFTITNVVLTEVSEFPEGGELSFSTGSFDLVVEYDGEEVAYVTVNGVITFSINLETGVVTPVGD